MLPIKYYISGLLNSLLIVFGTAERDRSRRMQHELYCQPFNDGDVHYR